LKRFSPAVLVISFVTLVLLLTASIWRGVAKPTIPFYIYNGTLILTLLFLLLTTLVIGLRMRWFLARMVPTNEEKRVFTKTTDFLNRVTRMVFVISVGFLAALLTAIVFTIYNPRNAWYPVVLGLYRAEEVLVVAAILLFLQRRDSGLSLSTSKNASKGGSASKTTTAAAPEEKTIGANSGTSQLNYSANDNEEELELTVQMEEASTTTTLEKANAVMNTNDITAINDATIDSAV
jgi:hypothetical protein